MSSTNHPVPAGAKLWHEVVSLPEGETQIFVPSHLSEDSIHELEQHFALLIRRLRRQAETYNA